MRISKVAMVWSSKVAMVWSSKVAMVRSSKVWCGAVSEEQ